MKKLFENWNKYKNQVKELDEGVENITPENIQLALQALEQVAVTFSPAVAGAAIAGLYAKYQEDKKEKEAGTEPAPPMQESRADHISGIDAKLDRLGDEIGRAEDSLRKQDDSADMSAYGGSEWETEANLDDIRSSPGYWETQQRIMRMREKLDLLQSQLDTLQSAPEGESVGELPRGDG